MKKKDDCFNYKLIQNLFFEYSYLMSMYIFDVMFSIRNEKDFMILFDQFCIDLMSVQNLNVDRLIDFCFSLIEINVIFQSKKFIIKSFMNACYKCKEKIEIVDKNIILFLYSCIENNLLTVQEIVNINQEILKPKENTHFYNLFNNIEEAFISFTSEESFNSK